MLTTVILTLFFNLGIDLMNQHSEKLKQSHPPTMFRNWLARVESELGITSYDMGIVAGQDTLTTAIEKARYYLSNVRGATQLLRSLSL